MRKKKKKEEEGEKNQKKKKGVLIKDYPFYVYYFQIELFFILILKISY